ncbi:MAG TPA: hypothetical protein VJN62_08580 [Gemmatimonadales bacterium]|nr:hypothetical protein [Gemmatimonadales bacterium]
MTRMKPVERAGNPILDGVIIGIALAVAWTVAVWFTHSPLRLVGWGVGGLIGIRLSRCAATVDGPSLEVLAVAFTAGTVLLAKGLMLAFALRPMVYDELMRNHVLTTELFAADLRAHHAFSPALQASLDSAEASPSKDPEAGWELRKQLLAEARARDSRASRDERERLVRAYEDTLMARKGEGTLPIFGTLLDFWDMIWVSLGVASARELARTRVR